MDPLPTINKVYSLVVQEESNFAISNPVASNSDDSSVLVNASDSKKHFNRGKSPMTNGKGKGETRHCTFCDRSGHTVDWCYKKHGNPNIRGNSGANVVASDGGDSSTPTDNTEMVTSGLGSGISQEKYDQLVNLLQKTSLIPSASPNIGSSSNHIHTSSVTDSGLLFQTPSLPYIHSIVSCSIQVDSKFWLIDSGANDHICSSLDWFSSYYKIKPVHVNLPNGNSVVVNYAGNIHFSQDLYITHVLYSPEFRLNLIFVSKLCANLSCCVEFSSHKCVIQDVTSKKMIGLGDQANGLYRLVVNGSHHDVSTIDLQLSNKTAI
jgi:hypothetical protein